MPSIIIIGSGPAGISAALYAVRAGVDTTVLTKGPGALDRAEKIENYYGFAQPVSGAELERRSIENARRLGVQFGDDVDVEAIVDNMMEIQREIGLKMYEYGWYFAKGGDGIHKV